MSDNHSNVFDFLSEKYHEVKYELYKLKRQDRQLKKDRKVISAEFDATDYADIAAIDTSEYQKAYNSYTARHAELTALEAELKCAKYVLEVGEIPPKELCVRMSRVVEILDQSGQKVFESNDPNLFLSGLEQKKEFPLETKTLLTEIREARELIEKASQKALPDSPKTPKIYTFGGRLKLSTLTLRQWLGKMERHIKSEDISVLEREKSEAEREKSELMNRTRFRPERTPEWHPTYSEIKESHREWWRDVEEKQDDIENLNRRINNLKSESEQIKKQVSEVLKILLLWKLPEQTVSLDKAIDHIDAEIAKLEALEAPNVLCADVVEQWAKIKPILVGVSKMRVSV